MRALEWATVVLLAAAGCGNSVDCSKVMLTLSGSERIVGLSAADQRALCDYTACQVGGYGAKLTCSSGPAVTVASSQSKCVAQLPTNPACHATVDDLVTCTEAVAANACLSTLFSSDCDAVSAPECLVITPGAEAVLP